MIALQKKIAHWLDGMLHASNNLLELVIWVCEFMFGAWQRIGKRWSRINSLSFASVVVDVVVAVSLWCWLVPREKGHCILPCIFGNFLGYHFWILFVLRRRRRRENVAVTAILIWHRNELIPVCAHQKNPPENKKKMRHTLRREDKIEVA